ncbi:Uncharacterised protein [Bordetella pertussis]|nr:Uncharacterised protein [Bordetella pertussis]CFN98624.1 Uncharacterised protein [Bordetella pertussis]
MKSTSPARANCTRSCATDSASVVSCALSTSHCASEKCASGMSRPAASARTQGAPPSQAASQAVNGSLWSQPAGNPRFLFTPLGLRKAPVPVSSRCASARHWSSASAMGGKGASQSCKAASRASPLPASAAAARRAGPHKAWLQPRGNCPHRLSSSCSSASASDASRPSRSSPNCSSGIHWSRWPSIAAMASLAACTSTSRCASKARTASCSSASSSVARAAAS